ncbi:MarR family winged helix-turn-helix transcriptional regulator [Streptomyces sp. NRRL F-525]|uniref:MarR family winged helix-turn-helix transcriptional regulator n=1 Tax=Streptomyces sp. NRRL F-525 TaxID=1463861 RepID=UPI000524B388|nr:MarR family winged helix-turn-helix transcriptional regulator [Streptomyces sp. NRRL F-525]
MPRKSDSVRPGQEGEEGAVPTVAEAPMSEALFRAARVHRLVAGSLLRDTGLYTGQELLMMQLWERGEQRQADLIKTLGLDPSTVTKMLQRLEQSGFVTRKPSPDDRRAVVVSATRAGQALRSQVKKAWSDLEKVTAAGFTEAEYDQAMRVLARIEANLTTAPSAGEASASAPDATDGTSAS